MNRFVTLIAAILFSAVTTPGTTYFIDYSSGSDLNSGTSRSEAWQKCPGMADFDGAYTHSSGDTFVFKGGVVWPVAALPLTIAYSGSSGNTDTYTSDHSWYSGATWEQPTMDGQLNGRTILTGTGRSYFKIDDIRIVNAGSLSANTTKGIELSDCDNFELSNNTFAPESWGCLYIWTSKPKNFYNYSIHHNDISKCAFGIRMVPSGASSIINNVQIFNNNLHDFHSQLTGEVHGDGIQHYCAPDVDASYDRYINGFKIFNNSFTGDFSQVAGSKGAMTALVYLSGASKNVEIFNNLFAPFTSGTQSPNFFESYISLRDNPNRGGCHKIYNNTFVTRVPDGQVAALLEDDPNLPSPGLDVKNNIFTGFKRPINLRSLNHTFDYNNIKFTVNVGKWGGAWVETFGDWQKLGNDIHGISVDPQFVSPTDFHLRPDSPCKDHGALLDEPYKIDRDGEIRPQGPTFDLGAFETPEETIIHRTIPVDIPRTSADCRAPATLLSDNSIIFDLSGRLVKSVNNRMLTHSSLPVIVTEKKRTFSNMILR